MNIPVARVLADLAEKDPDRVAITCGETSITFGELDAASNRLARAYEARQVYEGSFVTIMLPNSIEFYVAAFAIWKLGATPQPVSHRLPDRELDAIIDLADPSLVVGVDKGVHRGRPTIPAGFRPPDDLSDGPLPYERVSPAWKAPTSGGSTGRPKLIVSGEDGRVDPMRGTIFGMKPSDVHLVPGPLYHNAPFLLSSLGSYMGQHLVVLERFDAVAALEAIRDHRVTFVNLVPTMMLRMWRVLSEDPDRYDLSSLETVWHMAAPCPAWLKEAWIELVGPEVLHEMYGGTEGQSATVITGTEWLERRGSVGRPILGEMVVFDPDGNPVAPGVEGEIYMRRTPGTPPTYRYIGAEPRVLGDWETIGDMGWMDADGYVYLNDRRTDMILSGGANIYPAEVEAALMEHPHVETCIVVGLRDPDLGQRAHAVVQPRRGGGDLSAEILQAFLAERLVRYKIPRSFRLVDEPLRDDAGKARRTQIRDREAELLGVSDDAPGPG